MTVAVMLPRPINALSMIVLARLLDPHDFGLVALALILLSTTNLFSGLGLSNALIHSSLDKRQVAFQVFAATFLFSMLLFLGVNLNASFFANLLGDPAVQPILHWLSLRIILDAMFLVPDALLRKDLLFGRVSKASILSTLAYSGVAVGCALGGLGLWSLVIGELARGLANTVYVWFACPGWDWLRPKRWDWAAMKSLQRFGIHSMGAGLVSWFNMSWGAWLVGRTLGSTSLGFYSRSYELTTRNIAGFSTGVLSGVFFPAYTRMREDTERLSRAYLKALGVVALVIAPLAFGLAVVAPEAVPIVLGAKWLPMVTTLQLLSVMTLLWSLAASTAPLFLAVGRPSYNLRAGLVVLVVMAPLVLLLLGQDIEGVALAVTAAYFAGLLFNIYQVQLVLPGTALRMVLAILPALVASLAMVLAVHFSKAPLYRLTGDQYGWLLLGAIILIGALVYALVALLLQRVLILEAISLLISAFSGRDRMTLGDRPVGG